LPHRANRFHPASVPGLRSGETGQGRRGLWRRVERGRRARSCPGVGEKRAAEETARDGLRDRAGSCRRRSRSETGGNALPRNAARQPGTRQAHHRRHRARHQGAQHRALGIGNAKPTPAVFSYVQPGRRTAHFVSGRIAMVSLARAERKAARLVRDVKDIDLDDLYDQLENLRGYVNELSQSVDKSASRQYGRARAYTSQAAKEAEELMKDNLAASLILVLPR